MTERRVVRTYELKESTAMMIQELKLNSSNVNITLNEIVDEAISYYYAKVMTEDSNNKLPISKEELRRKLDLDF